MLYDLDLPVQFVAEKHTLSRKYEKNLFFDREVGLPCPSFEGLNYRPTPFSECIEDYVKLIRAREAS
jgi:hypothetical protein